jgi:hypothetical protein
MSSLVAVAVATGLLMLHSFGIASAQDTLLVNPDSVKLKFENDRVRVLESILLPGGKEKMHSHPSYVVYVIKGGRSAFTVPTARRPRPNSRPATSSTVSPLHIGARTSALLK